MAPSKNSLLDDRFLMATELDRPLSALSITSSSKSDIDWDRSLSGSGGPPVTPSPRRRRVELPPTDGTPSASRPPRSLADLLRLHAEKGKDGGSEDVHLTADEERRLREALDNWVNSEDDDAQYHSPNSSGDDEGPPSRSRSTTLVASESSSSEPKQP